MYSWTSDRPIADATSQPLIVANGRCNDRSLFRQNRI